MVLAQRLEGRQTQAPVMTAQMQASVRLLQLANEELQATLELYVQENPLLELKESRKEADKDNATADGAEVPADDDFTLNMWSDRTSKPTKTTNASESPSLDWIPEENESLSSFLQKQIEQTFVQPQERFLATQMAHILDEWGYFRHCLKDLGRQLVAAPSQLSKILQELKGMEPVGVFSQSLEECLEIQLRDIDRYSALHEKLLPHLKDLFGKNSHKLRQQFDIKEEELKTFVEDIRRCSPKPAQGWHDEDESILKSPDVIVFRTSQGALRIRLNAENLPRLLVNRSYVDDLTDTLKTTPDKQASKYFREKVSEANWLQRSLHQRAETILKVTREILKHQKNFFEQGVSGLKPLCLKNIAQILKIHESTVSRAISNKTVETPRGIVALKSFFTTGLTNYEQEQTSAASIQQRIRNIVDQENPANPYSDAQLINLLAGKGIRLARRTVAKYREILKIPTSYDRKHLKNRGF